MDAGAQLQRADGEASRDASAHVHRVVRRARRDAARRRVTRPILERYQRYLFLYRKANGEALSGRSQHMRLVPVKLWFRWLVKQNRILSNPAADIDHAAVEKRLPKHILRRGGRAGPEYAGRDERARHA
jgi:site-specific recombinase XerC